MNKMVALRIRPAIVLFGDSITQQGFGVDGNLGWASLLASAYSRRADVLNRGFSGYNTRHALDILPRVFGTPPDEGILFCTVLFGANDSALPGERQHVPMDEYKENLYKIVTSIRERIDQKGKRIPIILLSGTPVDEDAWNDHCAKVFDEPGMNRDNAVTRNYGECVKQVGSDLDCDVVDVFDLMGGNGNDYAKHLSDGLHLSSSGNTIIFEGIMSLIQKKYPHLAPMEGDGKSENSGIPMEEKLWTDLC